MPWTEIKIILTILAITLLPGWALLSLTGYCLAYSGNKKATICAMISNLNPEHETFQRIALAE